MYTFWSLYAKLGRNGINKAKHMERTDSFPTPHIEADQKCHGSAYCIPCLCCPNSLFCPSNLLVQDWPQEEEWDIGSGATVTSPPSQPWHTSLSIPVSALFHLSVTCTLCWLTAAGTHWEVADMWSNQLTAAVQLSKWHVAVCNSCKVSCAVRLGDWLDVLY